MLGRQHSRSDMMSMLCVSRHALRHRLDTLVRLGLAQQIGGKFVAIGEFDSAKVAKLQASWVNGLC